jgi:hypothetical protein
MWWGCANRPVPVDTRLSVDSSIQLTLLATSLLYYSRSVSLVATKFAGFVPEKCNCTISASSFSSDTNEDDTYKKLAVK